MTDGAQHCSISATEGQSKSFAIQNDAQTTQAKYLVVLISV